MKYLCVLCVLCSFALPSRALDREAFTFTNYALQVRLEPEQSRLGARGTIMLRNDSTQPQKIAVLQISSSLNWRSVKVGGKAVQFVSQPFVSDVDHTGALSEAIVTLPAEVKPKDSVEIEIAYEGTIVLDATRLTQIGVPGDLAKHTSWDQISPSFTAVRGVGYVTWYPIATASADFSEGNSLFQVVNRWKAREAGSSMSIDFCAGAGAARTLAVLMGDRAPGRGLGSMRTTNPALGSTSCVTHGFDPLGTISPTFALASYRMVPVKNASFPVRVQYLAGHENGADDYADAVEPAAKFVSQWFGKGTAPVTFADLADPNAAPFESGTLLLASMAGEDAKLAQINVVHELVHSALESPRPWIYEGLAHFAEALYREQQDGRQAALLLLGLHRAAFLDAEKDAAKNPGTPLATSFDEAYYRSKAAYVWWMLHDMIGDAALKQAIANYRAADDKDPKYIEKLVEAAAKRDLGWFFEDWVYQDRGLPDFRVQAVHPWTEKGVQIVTVTLENTGGAGAEVPFTVRFAGGEITRRMEVRAKSTATTRVEVPEAPTEVVVNDDSVPESDVANNNFKISQ